MKKTVSTLVLMLVCGIVNLFAMEREKPFEIVVSRFEAGNPKIEVVMDVYPTDGKCTLVPTVRFTDGEWIRTRVRFGGLLAALDEANRHALTNAWSTYGDVLIRRLDDGYEMKFSDGKFDGMVLTENMAKKLAHDIRFMLEMAKLNTPAPSSPTEAGQPANGKGASTETRDSSNCNSSSTRQPQEGQMPGSRTDGGEPANGKGSSAGKGKLPNNDGTSPRPPAKEMPPTKLGFD